MELGAIVSAFFVYYAILGVPFGYFTATVADEKGYNKLPWFIGGFFFLVIPLIAIAGMPLRKIPKEG